MWPFQRVFYYRRHPLAMGMGTMIGFILTGYLTIIRRSAKWKLLNKDYSTVFAEPEKNDC